VVAFGSIPIAPTPVLDRLRIELSWPTTLADDADVRILPFVNYFQRRPCWCWAAATKSINRFYFPDSRYTQCEIATMTLGRRCCSAAELSACDVRTSLAVALDAVGHYDREGPADPELVCDLIDDERPVGIFIEWTRNAGHFATIVGYGLSASGREFVVADPKYGARPVGESELLDGRYRGSGTWEWMYQTKKR
jgi:hypothetical protein